MAMLGGYHDGVVGRRCLREPVRARERRLEDQGGPLPPAVSGRYDDPGWTATKEPAPFHFDASRAGKPILDVPEPSARRSRTSPTLAALGQAHGGSRRARSASQRRDRGHESPARVRLLRRSQDVGRRGGPVRRRRHDGDRPAGRLRRAKEHPPRTERVGTRLPERSAASWPDSPRERSTITSICRPSSPCCPMAARRAHAEPISA